jgi:hypothetical protein
VHRSQTTSRVLMIRPAAFGTNPETLGTNAFQGVPLGSPAEIHARARAEFDAFVSRLRVVGVEVFLFEDTVDPRTPDAIFPNNWFSTHSDGTVVLYPMQPASRRSERRPDLFDSLAEDHGFQISRYVDFTDAEAEGLFLEGTGSLVLDHLGRIAYAALSARTRAPLLERFGGALGYQVQPFRASDRGMPVYHTNVVLSIGRAFAVIAEELIDDAEERALVHRRLEDGAREVIAITREQCRAFAGNLLELKSTTGDPVIVISGSAWASLDRDAKARIERYGTMLVCDVPTIEQAGGGSVRCMIAEIFLPKV